jgi:glutamyl-tRNA reductase
MVVGLNHQSAPLAMRERFFVPKDRRYEVLRELRTAEGIEEAVVLSTCCRTEFILWASEPTLAANSLIHYLGAEHGLKLSEWEHFYRQLGDAALEHVFRVTCGLDCQRLCEADVFGCMRIAWEQARTVGASGRFLNALLERAISISERVSEQTRSAKRGVTVPSVALELSRRIFGSVKGRKLLLLGTERTSEPAALLMCQNGAGPVVVIDQSLARAQELATKLGGTAATQADRWSYLLRADIVITATGIHHFVLTREEAERLAAERNRVAMVIFDICIPRNVDPEVRRVDGILLYDYEGLDRAARNPAVDSKAVPTDGEKIVMAEIEAFRTRLKAEVVVPTSIALAQRLEEICRQELESFKRDRGPFTREQDHLLHAIAAQIAQGIASSLARELKQIPEREEQERVAAAVARLFHRSAPSQAPADRTLEKEENEPKERTAINY